ncbi:MAG: nickel pincer cofactor biosynthesis protein LarB [Desulfovibrio sp.]|nr:nickel pincer cofactor biosynthesis protein LarB [Desulfovibrio sp.]
MHDNAWLDILQKVADGALAPREALLRLGDGAIRDVLHGLTLDTQRPLRTGLGETVFAQGKSDAALVACVEHLAVSGPVLVSRVSPSQGELLQRHFPSGCLWPEARLFSLGGPETFVNARTHALPQQGEALIISAGAADMPVALESYGALAFWGKSCGCLTDAGVAGLHRLLPHLEALRKARVVIAVAGMEGALPGVLAGLVACPVVAVPTSVGYGVGEGGRAALTTMLCSCAPGVAVVNIDNGFGAAAFAAKLLG